MSVRFDLSAPYEVDEADVPFARPEGKERVARVYRPRGEAEVPLAALVDVHGGAWARIRDCRPRRFASAWSAVLFGSAS